MGAWAMMLHPQLRVAQVVPAYEPALPPGTVITIQSMPFCMGRGFANQLRVEHPDISRRHACLRLHDDYYVVEDLDSRNGTLVNAAHLVAGEQRRLHDGDTIQLAAVVSMVFVDPFVTRERPDVRPMRVRGLWLDPQAQIVMVGDERIVLSLQQYRLLALLYARAGTVVTRQEIAEALWSTGLDLTEQMIDNTVSRLRANLQKVDASHEYVVTVRGRGYQFVQLK
jgi:DNA-binding response OmpR family regulator